MKTYPWVCSEVKISVAMTTISNNIYFATSEDMYKRFAALTDRSDLSGLGFRAIPIECMSSKCWRCAAILRTPFEPIIFQPNCEIEISHVALRSDNDN